MVLVRLLACVCRMGARSTADFLSSNFHFRIAISCTSPASNQRTLAFRSASLSFRSSWISVHDFRFPNAVSPLHLTAKDGVWRGGGPPFRFRSTAYQIFDDIGDGMLEIEWLLRGFSVAGKRGRTNIRLKINIHIERSNCEHTESYDNKKNKCRIFTFPCVFYPKMSF